MCGCISVCLAAKRTEKLIGHVKWHEFDNSIKTKQKPKQRERVNETKKKNNRQKLHILKTKTKSKKKAEKNAIFQRNFDGTTAKFYVIHSAETVLSAGDSRVMRNNEISAQ